jgi:hypothetical protein
MSHNNKQTTSKKIYIKFGVPIHLKDTLQALADERNIGLSALLRLIATEYIRRHQAP